MKKLFYWGQKTQAHPKGNRVYDFCKKLEWRLFHFFLKRYCAQDLDQWEQWKIQTKHGHVYIQISRDDDGHNWNELK